MKVFKANDGKEYVVTDDCNLGDKTTLRNLQATVDALDGVDPAKHYGEVVPLDVLKFTDWSPDTCGCTVRYIWRLDHPEEAREHFPHRTLRHCAHHEHNRGNHDEHFVTVHKENREKNQAILKAAVFHDKNPSEFIWKYGKNEDGSRRLRIAHPDIGEINHTTLPEPALDQIKKVETKIFAWQDEAV